MLLAFLLVIADSIFKLLKTKNMKDEYVILNKTAIQKRIEEIEKINLKTSNEDERGFNQEVWNDLIHDSKLMSEYKTLQQLLSQSTPLIHEIEKSINYGIVKSFSSKKHSEIRQEYISNLKLDI